MNILDVAIIIFCLMESANIAILYFYPDSKKGNGVAVFESWFDCKEDQNMNLFAHYMAYWVAGTKLIFIMLLLVILFLGTETLKYFACIIMIISIASYFWKLHPIIVQLDQVGKITTKGYSNTLEHMIKGFIWMFSIVVVVYPFI